MQFDFNHLLEPQSNAPINLAEVLAHYDVSSHHASSRIRSAIRTVGRGLRLPLDQISAEPERLRAQLAQGSAAFAKVKPRAWIVAKSCTLGALRALGADILPSRDATPLSPSWEELLEQISGRGTQIGVSRFLRYLSRLHIEPGEVATEHFDGYRQELLTKSVRQGGERSYRQTVRHWKSCAATVPTWPQIDIAVPEDPRRYSLEWSAFAASFKMDVDAFLDSRRNPDPLKENYTPRVRPDTDTGRRNSLRAIASALALSGQVSTSEIVRLSVLTDIENVRSALRWMRDVRFGGKFVPNHVNHAELLRTIAKHWEDDATKADAIRALITSLNRELGDQSGITAKNRERLSQFDDPKNVEVLATLAPKTLKSARTKEPSHLQAVRVMYALQIGILLSAPIRLKNLVGLRLGESLLDTGAGKSRQLRISLPKAETKTYQDYVAPLPDYLWPVYDAWIKDYRRRVCDQPSPYLFPNSAGELRSRDSLSTKLSRFILRETGLKVNVHLFRHIAAKIYLAHDPDGLETVRQLLGHKTIATTLKAYAELQTDPAFRRLEEALLAVAGPSISRRGKGASR